MNTSANNVIKKTVKTVETYKVVKGVFYTQEHCAAIRVQPMDRYDEDKRVFVAISEGTAFPLTHENSQYMSPKDLREAAEFFNQLADAIDKQ